MYMSDILVNIRVNALPYILDGKTELQCMNMFSFVAHLLYRLLEVAVEASSLCRERLTGWRRKSLKETHILKEPISGMHIDYLQASI